MRGDLTKNRNPIRSIILLISLSLAHITTYTAFAALDLLYFDGQALQGGVFLEWETATEVNDTGFYITRSDSENGVYSRISSFIPAVGNSSSGAYYTYLDTNVSNDIVYWYQLEAVDVYNQSTFSEKIQVLVSSQTPTPTLPVAASQTASVTPTGSLPATSSTPTTPTPTVLTSALPSKTSTPGGVRTSTPRGTLSATPTMIPEATQTISSTTTLIPLPEITLQFPTPLTNPGAPVAGAETVQQKSSESKGNTALITIGRVIFLGFIVLIWLVLAGWIYFSSRQLE